MGKRRSGNAAGFASLGLSEPVFAGVVKAGFSVPTPVQRRALPACLSGSDVVVMARTGSGKTAAFVLPILERFVASKGGVDNAVVPDGGNTLTSSVILSPTRELALQTLRVVRTLGHHCEGLRVVSVLGAESMEKQFAALTSRPDVIVATPGRLAHHLAEIPDLSLRRCACLVLDEADRLFEMGFSHQIREICRTLPETCQRMLFSATMPRQLAEFARVIHDPQVIRLDSEVKLSDELRLAFVAVRTEEKDAALLWLLRSVLRATERRDDDDDENDDRGHNLTLVFCATRHHVEYVTHLLRAGGVDAAPVYGTMDSHARKENLAAFRSGRVPVLVTTDVAARGVDVPLLRHVVHHATPPSPRLFVHRSGRAARAGRVGHCVVLVDPDETAYAIETHAFLGRKLDNGPFERNYSLDEMTPDEVHFGTVPSTVMTEHAEEVERLLSSSSLSSSVALGDVVLSNLRRVADNATKQYRRSRPEASRASLKRAREMNNARHAWNAHPLLVRAEEDSANERRGGGGAASRRDAAAAREAVLRAVADYRPKETVFEAFSAGNVKVGEHQVDKTSRSADGAYGDGALRAMKNMRRQMRLAKDKGAAMVVAGSDAARAINGDEDETTTEEQETRTSEENKEPTARDVVVVAEKEPVAVVASKKRLSKAERKRLKKQGNVVAVSTTPSPAATVVAVRSVVDGYRDPDHYVGRDRDAAAADVDARRQDDALRPSAVASGTGAERRAHRLEEAVLDLVGDEHEDLVMRRRMTRWDKSKKKYVTTTVGEELGRPSRVRTESGAKRKRSDEKERLGDLYEKWRRRTRRDVAADDDTNHDDHDDGNADADAPLRRLRRRAAERGGGGEGDAARTATAVRKEREAKQKLKVKNMKRSDRRAYEARTKAAATDERTETIKGRKGFQGKKGFSGNWKKSSKR